MMLQHFSVFLREVYDGQLVVKLKKGRNLPAMDPWVRYYLFFFLSNISMLLSHFLHILMKNALFLWMDWHCVLLSATATQSPPR